MLGMIVAATLRRNRKITITTSAIVSISENSTSLTDARIVVVRSSTMVVSMPLGIEALMYGSCARMPSTVWMMLAPGWRKMISRTDGLPFA